MLAASWFQRQIVDTGRLALLVTLAAFIVTFVVTRVVTRMIRAGKGPFHDHVTSGGTHVHHAVPGLILLIVGAFTAVATDADEPWAIAAGLMIGAGTSLVLDEFALILHLTDVYWADEGRVSVEMVSLAVACLGFVLIGVSPVTVPADGRGGAVGLLTSVVALSGHIGCIVACVAKGKYRMALFGAFLPLIALFGALRLARPRSRWARRHYDDHRLAHARRRDARWESRYGRFGDWASDFVAGKPSAPDPPPAAPTA